MAWMVERRLRKVSARLVALREELDITTAQLDQVAEEADDLATRALVSDRFDDAAESRQAVKHAETMRRNRQHIIEQIAALERRQDELLDQM